VDSRFLFIFRQWRRCQRAIDGDSATLWHTDGNDAEHNLPQQITIDLGTAADLKGFTYTPRQDKTLHGMVDHYTFQTSTDGKEWKTATEGEFGNLRTNPIEQSVTFTPVKARYFKFIARHSIEMNHAAIAEMGIIE